MTFILGLLTGLVTALALCSLPALRNNTISAFRRGFTLGHATGHAAARIHRNKTA